jgi:hypothetical protein
MSNNDEKKNLPVTTIDGWDGFTDDVEGTATEGLAGRVSQGDKIAFTNEVTWVCNDEQISPEREFFAVNVIRVVQKWKDGMPVETRILGPGEKIPDIEALNAACPKSEWGTDQNGNPRGPWAYEYVTYLLDPVTLDKYWYPTSTIGGGIAVRDLKDKTQLMRKFRGEKVCAVVTLGDCFMNTRFGGRQRPHFIVKRWVTFGGEKPALAAPTEPPKDLPGAKVVAEPSLKEQMNDEVPWNDSPDLNAPPPKIEPLPEPKKSAAPAKPPINKKGVQKFATGGRR